MHIEEQNGRYKYVEWYIDYRTGKRKRVCVSLDKNTASARREAQRILDAKIAERNSRVNPEELTLGEAVERYLEYQKETVKPSTLTRNTGSLNAVCKILGGDTLLDSLNAGYINRQLLKSGRSHKTLNEDITRMKAFLRWCYKNDLVKDVGYLDKIEKFKTEGKPESLKYLERDELNLLLSQLTVDYERLLIEFLALSGLRIGEAIALEKKDVDTENRLIHVDKTFDPHNGIVTSTKTETSNRDVYIQNELMELIGRIKEYYFHMPYRGDLFFTNNDGKRVQHRAVEKYFRENCIRVLEKPLTVHSLRHTHASLLFEQGMSLEAVSRRLGHADSKITRDIYLHVTEEEKRRDRERLDEIELITKQKRTLK